MTVEEMERAIQTLINHRANFESQLERTDRQVEQTSKMDSLHCTSITSKIIRGK